MTSSFAALKKSRSKEFEKLHSQLQKMNSTGPQDDDRFWKLEVDKAGNGYAIIRFLPAPKGEDMPFIRMWDHGFQGPGGWYIENSLTTIGQDDPVSDYNSKLWNSGIESNKDIVRKQKRRLNYYANIYVVKDEANPDNEGKVFIYKFGKKIYDKLNEAMNPEFEDEEAMNPFDFWSGADFKLKARQVDGWRNYDKSEFTTPGVLADKNGTELSDEELEKIWEQEYPLQEFLDPKNFKTYEELQAKLFRVLGEDSDNVPSAPHEAAEPKEQKEMESSISSTYDEEPTSEMDEDDDLSFFKQLSEED